MENNHKIQQTYQKNMSETRHTECLTIEIKYEQNKQQNTGKKLSKQTTKYCKKFIKTPIITLVFFSQKMNTFFETKWPSDQNMKPKYPTLKNAQKICP